MNEERIPQVDPVLQKDMLSQLLERAKRGDEKAFENLMKDALPKVLGLARRMLKDDNDAWDAAQEAFLKAWTNLSRFRGDSSFSTWTCGILVRLALDRLREKKNETGNVPDHGGLEPSVHMKDLREDPELTVENRSLRMALEKAVEGLPDGERAVFRLHEFAGMKYREVAAALDIPQGTVMSRLSSARGRLRIELSPWWKEATS